MSLPNGKVLVVIVVVVVVVVVVGRWFKCQSST
jgi:hypothetical protein